MRRSFAVSSSLVKGFLLPVFALCSHLTFASESTAPAASSTAASPTATKTAPAVGEPADASTPARVRLITSDQYFNTIGHIFGDSIKVNTPFPPMARSDGLLASGASSAGITAAQVEQYQRVAALIAGKVVDPAHRNFLIPCQPADPKAADAKCATKFLSAAGRLLYRRPLTTEAVQATTLRANQAAEQLHDFYKGLGMALEGMLIHPDMLFVADRSEPDPARPGQLRLDSYSLASRLSFFFWNAAPDDALLTAAEKGELHDANGRAHVIDRMLRSPRLVTGVRAYFDDMLGFDAFNNLSKDATIYPAFTGVTVRDAREQALLTIVDQLVTKNNDYRDLFTTRQTFISPSLAVLYDLPVTSSEWMPYEFPADSPRIGFLTQIGFLASHAHPGRSSATLRGKAVRELLLCQRVPPPPGNVDFSIVENPNSNFKTGRERITAHSSSNPVCAGCHRVTDPMGLAFENFDGAGRFRQTERGAPIDVSGNLDGKKFQDVAGLSEAFHDHPGLPVCLVKRMYSYATGGPTSKVDQPVLKYLDSQFSSSGYRVPELMRTIALSNAFSTVRETDTTPATKTAAALNSKSNSETSQP